MTQKTSSLLNLLKFCLKTLQSFSHKFNSKFPNVSQNIQLTCLYLCALIDLSFSILQNVYYLGYFPEILQPYFPLIQNVLLSPFLQVWVSPEKSFFVSYLFLDWVIIRSAFGLNKLMKYNVLLVFALLMVQGVMLSYWDLLFNREFLSAATEWSFDQGILLSTDINLTISFYFTTFFLFCYLYGYFYYFALQGKFGNFPGLGWLSSSVAFWLRIKVQKQ